MTPKTIEANLNSDTLATPTISVVPEEITPVQPAIAEQREAAEPQVRGATFNDIDALTTIELSAYENIYGTNPTAEVVDAVSNKYRERVELLGDFVRVLETPQDGVYGMLVCCPTNLRQEALTTNAFDMTDNETLRSVYDPNGKSGYIVNLAIRPDKQGGRESIRLFGDAITLGMELGVSETYFESRLPGFQKWVDRQRTAGREEDLELLASEYWQTTRTGHDGKQRRIDPLLRGYESFGAQPLALVKDAWNLDTPSAGYGVLCKLDIPPRRTDEEATQVPAAAEVIEVTHGAGASDLTEGEILEEGATEGLKFWSGVADWIKRKKTAVALGLAAAGTGYTTVTGGSHEIVDGLRENAPWVLEAYGGSMAAYGLGAAVMAAAVGQKGAHKLFSHFLHSNVKLHSFEDEIRSSVAMKVGFWTNTLGGVAAAGVAGAGVIESLPPTAWSALAIPAVDLFSTITIRNWALGKLRSKS